MDDPKGNAAGRGEAPDLCRSPDYPRAPSVSVSTKRESLDPGAPVNFQSVFAKTERGHQEIERRSHGLDARHRTLLILVDGRRTLGALGDLLGHGGDLAPMLTQLQALGLVASAGVEPPAEDRWAASSELATQRLAEILRPMADAPPAIAAKPARPPESAGKPRPGLLARCRSLVTEAGRGRQE